MPDERAILDAVKTFAGADRVRRAVGDAEPAPQAARLTRFVVYFSIDLGVFRGLGGEW